MKVLAGLLWASIAAEVYAQTTPALMYLVDAGSSNPNVKPLSITPNTARLLFAQRLGLSQYHDLGDIDDSTLEILNSHGGNLQKVFLPEDEHPGKSKLLVVVEGVEHPEDVMTLEQSTVLAIGDPPAGSATQQLVMDLLEQDMHQRSRQHDICSLRFPAGPAALSGGINGLPVGLTQKDGESYRTTLEDLRSFIERYRLYGTTSTIVFTPPSRRTTKRSSSYGTYTMPYLLKREQPETEEVLSTGNTSSNTPSQPTPESLQTTPLPHGILPVCHSHPDSAISATNNCSGHGTIYKKSSGVKDCYACRCGSTKLTDSDGKVKTVHWGGSACQKKDISMPFFLLAGLTIGLIAVVAWGIALLVSIGQEDLPSVIGAGVAGPRAQK
ncbi:MAG: hypothetical protein Q9163_001720 [Psora crenata]